MERRTLFAALCGFLWLLPALCLADGGQTSDSLFTWDFFVWAVLGLVGLTAYVSAFGHFVIGWWQFVAAGFRVGVLWGLVNMMGWLVFPFGLMPFTFAHWKESKGPLRNVGIGFASLVAGFFLLTAANWVEKAF